MWEVTESKKRVVVAVVVAGNPRQVAHRGLFSCRGEGVEMCTCINGGVGSHILTDPQRGGATGEMAGGKG